DFLSPQSGNCSFAPAHICCAAVTPLLPPTALHALSYLGCQAASGKCRTDSLLEDHLGALEVEAEAHLAQAGLRHGTPQTHLLLGVEHQEATAAGADQLAAQRPVRLCQLVPLVDPVVAHRTAALLLVFPVDVHQLGEADEVAGLHRLLALVAQ